MKITKSNRRKITAGKSLEEKRNSKNPYMYFTKHGIGPGTLPKDVKLVNWEDLDDYMTVIYVDRPLSTKELENYDIIPETRNRQLMEKYGIISSTCTKRKFTVKAARRIDIDQWENSYEPDEYSTDPEGLGYEQNRAISLVGDILDDWSNRTSTKLDNSIIDEVYDLACSEPMSCKELADEVYSILEEAYPELVDSATRVNKFTIKAASDVKDYDKFELITFAEDLIKELQQEYNCKLSTDAFLGIIDIAEDPVYFEGAHKYGSTPQNLLEALIYDVFEEDTGVVISSEKISKKFPVNAATNTEVSQGDVDELVLYITNDGRLYEQVATPIIKNMKRKRKNGNYDDKLAVKGWQHLADEGVRRYDKEFGSGRGSLTMLNKATRIAIAEELKEYYEDEVSYEEQTV